MLRSIGKFTVHWNRRGSIFYTAWFETPAEGLHCKHFLRSGAEIVSSRGGGDRGVLEKAEFLSFPGPGALEKPAQEILRKLPRPFFVTQCLGRPGPAQQKVFREPPPPEMLRADENFVFPETETLVESNKKKGQTDG